MGIIGNKLLKKIEDAEQSGNWDELLEVLDEVRHVAWTNYVNAIKDLAANLVNGGDNEKR